MAARIGPVQPHCSTARRDVAGHQAARDAQSASEIANQPGSSIHRVVLHVLDNDCSNTRIMFDVYPHTRYRNQDRARIARMRLNELRLQQCQARQQPRHFPPPSPRCRVLPAVTATVARACCEWQPATGTCDLLSSITTGVLRNCPEIYSARLVTIDE